MLRPVLNSDISLRKRFLLFWRERWWITKAKIHFGPLIKIKFQNLSSGNVTETISEFNACSGDLKDWVNSDFQKVEFIEIRVGPKFLKTNNLKTSCTNCAYDRCALLFYIIYPSMTAVRKTYFLLLEALPSWCLREMLNSERWVINNHNGDESVKRTDLDLFNFIPPICIC